MNILIACEQSQVVCAAFRRAGFEAFSSDIERCRGGHPEWHIEGDCLRLLDGFCDFVTADGRPHRLDGRWDLLIAHPPCQMLTHCGAQHYTSGRHSYTDVVEAARFFLRMLAADCRHIAVENPAPMKVAGLPPYSQIIQPYQFGHPYSKRVCLWLRNLPPLIPMTGYYEKHAPWLGHCSGRPARRAQTFAGIAEAMAAQWGDVILKDYIK